MKIYTAAAWGRRDEIKKIAAELEKLHVTITARWLNEPIPPQGSSVDKWRRETALVDIADIREADVLVRFSDADEAKFPLVSSSLISSARMFECGFAWGLGKPIVVVGGRQNVFDYLPNVTHVKDVDELKKYLSLN
jgi:nucleoside 2-deoxyribosyltransferase